MSKFGTVIVWLACAAPALAAAPQQDREVWITIGSDALPTVRASLKEQGQELAAAAREKGGVTALRVRESQIDKIAGVMHDKLNRCAGFIAHDSEAEALKAVETASAPQQSLATLISFNVNNGPSVNAMLSGVQELNIRNTINSLSTNWTTRRYNVQSGADAANWLKTQWTNIAAGRTDVSVALYTHTWTQPSVIATITGTTLPNEVVVLGGHLDSINQGSSTGAAPGADDDASGVASITEVFRVAMANGYKPARTVKFMAYAGEEVGLYGSNAIATSFKNAGTNVVGVLQLDMTNYKGSSYDFGMVTDNTNATLNSFVTGSLLPTYVPGTTYTNITCGYACSDHASWSSAGYPATMPFEATMTTDNPQIHTAGDTLTYTGGTATNSVKFAKLGVAFMGEVAKGATTGNTPPPTGGGTGGGGNTLTNGVASAAYSGATGSWTCWTLAVPTGKTSLVFNQAGGTGDADLYVKQGTQPTTSSYTCRPYLSGNTESCTISNPASGTWYACSYGYSSYSSTTMKGTY